MPKKVRIPRSFTSWFEGYISYPEVAEMIWEEYGHLVYGGKISEDQLEVLTESAYQDLNTWTSRRIPYPRLEGVLAEL